MIRKTNFRLTIQCKVCFRQMGMSVRICDGEEQHAFVMCTECQATYRDPALEVYAGADPVELACPDCDGSLDVNRGHWATEAEAIDLGWEAYIYRSK